MEMLVGNLFSIMTLNNEYYFLRTLQRVYTTIQT